MQGGKDPDELIREKGLAAFKEVMAGSLPLWDVLWEREVSKEDIRTPDARAALEHRFYSIIQTISDPTVKTAYRRTCRIELSELFWQATKGRRVLPKEGLVNRELKIEKEGHRHGLQKVLLGMLVHFPDFIDEKSDEIARVHFSDELEKFRSALYDLLIMHEEIDVSLIYDKLGKDYYNVLQDIHGDKEGERQRGHRLFARFPILEWEPPRQFVSDCIDHFVQVLQVAQMNEERQSIIQQVLPNDENFDVISTRLTELMRDIHHQTQVMINRDMALAEEASEIRRLGMPADSRLPSSERVREFA
jgi:DNA primase